MQRVHRQAHPSQVHLIDHRADDRRLVCLAVHAALGGIQPGAVPEEPQVLGRLLAFDLGAAGRFAVGAQAAQRGDVAGVAVGPGGQCRVPGGDRDAAAGRAGRELRAAAGDGRRAGRDRGRGGLPLPPAGLRACFPDSSRAPRSRLAALRALALALRALSRRRSCTFAGDRTSHAAASSPVHPHSRSSARS